MTSQIKDQKTKAFYITVSSNREAKESISLSFAFVLPCPYMGGTWGCISGSDQIVPTLDNKLIGFVIISL